MAHSEQGDFIIKIDKTFDNDARFPRAATRLGIAPNARDIGLRMGRALPFARGGHDGFDDAGQANLVHGGAAFGLAISETIGRGGQAQILRCKSPDALAVHGDLRGARRGNDGEAFGLKCAQCVRSNRLYFRDDQIRPLFFGNFPQSLSVQHIDDIGAVGDLHGGRIGIAVHGNDFDAQPLQLNHNFLTQLPTAAHHDFGGTRGEGSSESDHGVVFY